MGQRSRLNTQKNQHVRYVKEQEQKVLKILSLAVNVVEKGSPWEMSKTFTGKSFKQRLIVQYVVVLARLLLNHVISAKEVS